MTTTVVIYVEPMEETAPCLRALALHAEENGEVTLCFDCYVTPYDPGRTSGPPERCYPPEGGFEECSRVYCEVQVNVSGVMRTHEVELEGKLAEAVWQHYRDQVEVEAVQQFVNWCDEPEPDDDDY